MLVAKISIVVVFLNIFLPLLLKSFGFKVNFNTLRCGMVGYCGDVPADPNIIKLLLMFNQSRGEDSTGWAINNKITKDTDKASLFLTKNKLTITPEDVNYSVICHARRASSGGKYVKELAHPFGMYKDAVEKERYDLILAMNGTLTFLDEFCKEFGVENKAVNSDTQMLARIMCELGEKEYTKALERYAGAATLLFMSPKYTNTLMVYKDAERPLYYWQKDKNQMYIASMDDALQSVGADKENVIPFTDGKVFRINKGKITKSFEIDRTNPVKAAINKTVKNSRIYSPGSSNYKPDSRSWSAEQEVELSNVGRDAHSNTKVHAIKGNCIYLYCDRYHENGHPVTGIKNVSPKGELSVTEREGYDKMYFFFGYMCKSEEAYKKICGDLGEIIKEKQEVNIPKFKLTKISDMCENFKYPVTSYINDDTSKFRWILDQEWIAKADASGTLQIDLFLSNAIITVKDTGGRTKGNKKGVFEEVLVKLKSSLNAKVDPALTAQVNTVLDSLKIRYTERDSKNEIRRRILAEGDTQWPTTIFRSMKIDYWQVNTSCDIDSYYYTLLFELFSEAELAEHTEIKAIFTSGERNFTDVGFLTDVKKLQNLYVKYLQSVGKSSIETNPEDPHDNSSFHESDEEEVDEVPHIETIKRSNDFYSQPNFKRDFYEATYPQIGNFADIWISQEADQTEKYRFYEGVMLCLLHIGKIKNSDFLEFLEYPANPANINKVAKNYEEYIAKVKGKSVVGNTSIEDAEILEEEEEQNVEGFDSEAFEQDVINNYLDMLNNVSDEIETIKVFAVDNTISVRTEDIVASLVTIRDTMKKNVNFEEGDIRKVTKK